MPITRGLKAIQDPSGKSKGRCDCRYPSPDKTFTSPVARRGFAEKLIFLVT